jgi:diaminopropionate ammonia-lyase
MPNEIRLLANPIVHDRRDYGDGERRGLSLAGGNEACDAITAWPGYAPTPLRSLDGLAREHRLGRIWYKDEGSRFGLGSFKAIGGAYGVQRALTSAIRRQTGVDSVRTQDLLAGRYRDIAQTITVTCATDGNHGRSVAWGAQTFGLRCVIYVPRALSAGREDAIRRFGAETVRVDGTYDDALHRCGEDARLHHRIIVSDTSSDEDDAIPRDIMHGYMVLVREVLSQLPRGERPTHVVVQAGVGGLAAAVFGYLWETWGADRPTFVIAEPETAACLFESARAGEIVRLDGSLETLMAGLSCGEPSRPAWRVLAPCVDWFATLSDDLAAEAMRILARGTGGDAPVVAGESAVAGLAATLALRAHPDLAASVGLDETARVLLIGTEGATDPEIYERIVSSRA